MRIYHINTGTMCPIGRRFVNGTGSIFQRARMVCHCLLVETNDGLALVDTGIGLGDIANPPRLGRKWVRQTTPRLDPADTSRLSSASGDSRSPTLTWLNAARAASGESVRCAIASTAATTIGLASDASAERPLCIRPMAAWSRLGVLRRGRRGLVRLQGRARARRPRS